MNHTQNPFGDPAATRFHQQAELLAELQRRATRPPELPRPRDPLAPVSGELQAPTRHGWTVVAVLLLVVVLAACAVVAAR